MASVKKTVRRTLLAYPGLYKTAGDVIFSLFITTGNGYRWKNGELKARKDMDPYTPWTPEDERAEYKETYGKRLQGILGDEGMRDLRARVEEDITENEKVITEIDQRMEDMTLTEPDSSLFPPTQNYNIDVYAAIRNLPEDIKPDWADAAAWVMTQIGSIEEHIPDYERGTQ